MRFEGDLNALLTLISTFPLRLKSLKLSNHSKFPENGLRAFSKKITSLTSLTCSNLQNKHLVLISNCFPLLEELDISYPKRTLAVVLKAKYFKLPKLHTVNLSCYNYRAKFLKDHDVFELFLFLGDLVYINISKCCSLTNFALFALLRNCAKFNEVRMEDTSIGNMRVVNYYEMKVRGMNNLMKFVVYPHLKTLRLAHITCFGDKNINMFASVFPNLQLLDLSFCNDMSEEGIGQVFRKCSKIRHLNLANCSGMKLFKTNIEMLEALNLSHTRVDDEKIHVISTSCFRLQQLDLGHCYDVTEKGVMQVLENWAQLREINLQDCRKVSVDIVDSMVLRRPSLRKITTPPGFCCSDSKRELFLRLGCLVC